MPGMNASAEPPDDWQVEEGRETSNSRVTLPITRLRVDVPQLMLAVATARNPATSASLMDLNAIDSL